MEEFIYNHADEWVISKTDYNGSYAVENEILYRSGEIATIEVVIDRKKVSFLQAVKEDRAGHSAERNWNVGVLSLSGKYQN